MAKNKPSTQTIDEALKVAKGTAKPGQTKEQTKIIAQGIEKGIAEYKKREKAKARERDKNRKKEQNPQQGTSVEEQTTGTKPANGAAKLLPWLLLVFSWLGFALFWWLRS